MRVRMKIAISGSRNGADWPPAGGEIDLPDEEAEHLVSIGLATADDEEPDGGQAPEETATAPGEPEKATGRRKPMAKSATEK
jgi:hypothetical protein